MSLMFWINFLIGGVLYILMLGVFMTFCMKTRFRKIPAMFNAAIPMLLGCIPSYIRTTHPGTFLFKAMGVVQLVILTVYVILFFTDKWWKKILVVIMVVSVLSISEAIVMVFLSERGVSFKESFDTYEMFLHQLLTCIVSLLLYMLFIIIWKQLFRKTIEPHRAGVFLLFPISQLMMFWEYPDTIVLNPGLGIDYMMIFAALIGFAADIVFFCVLMSEGEKENMASQLSAVKNLYYAEAQHFKDIEKQDLLIAKIRHDMNNQMLVIKQLMESGNAEQATEMLSQITQQIHETTKKQWCGNHIVNAVLAEKEMICIEKGIQLNTVLSMGELSSIQPIHLCSAFSNMLDNAISATEKCRNEQKRIDLHVSVNGDYLQIKICNPSNPPDKIIHSILATNTHGHGQDILRDIAMLYNGSFLTDWKDGTYIAMLALDVKAVVDPKNYEQVNDE